MRFCLQSCYVRDHAINHNCAFCFDALTPPTDGDPSLLLIANRSCGHVFHAGCLETLLEAKSLLCPLCRTKWIDSEEEITHLAAITTTVDSLNHGVNRRLGWTELRVEILADQLDACVKLAAYAEVKAGKQFASTDDARAIIRGMLTAVEKLDGQARRLEVLREQLQVRSVEGMHENGDGRAYSDEMSEFALKVAEDAVDLYADRYGLVSE